MVLWICRAAALLFAIFSATDSASAGRPLVVDDIEPTSHERIAVEIGTAAEVGPRDRFIALPICVAWGALVDVELSAFVAAHFSSPAPVDDRELGLGDLGFGAKWKVLGTELLPIGAALTAAVTVPTGNAGFGAVAVTLDLMAVVTWSLGSASIDLNGGYAGSIESADVPSSGYVHGGIAFRHQASDAVGAVAEIYGDDDDGSLGVTGVGAGLQYAVGGATWLDGAVGAGIVAGDVRLLLTVGVTTEF